MSASQSFPYFSGLHSLNIHWSGRLQEGHLLKFLWVFLQGTLAGYTSGKSGEGDCRVKVPFSSHSNKSRCHQCGSALLMLTMVIDALVFVWFLHDKLIFCAPCMYSALEVSPYTLPPVKAWGFVILLLGLESQHNSCALEICFFSSHLSIQLITYECPSKLTDTSFYFGL